MDLSPLRKKLACFGLYEANVDERTLTKGGLRVRLQDQPFQILALLLEHPGEIVAREAIRQSLWSADTYVEFDDGLNTAMKKLRTALGDSADNPRFIETIPRRGYRFVAPVSFRNLAPAGPQELEKPETPKAPQNIAFMPSPRRNWRWGLALVLLVSGVGVILRLALPGSRDLVGSNAAAAPAFHIRRSVAVLGFRNLAQRPEQAWLSSALSEMLITELAAGGQIRTIPGENVARTKHDLALPDSDGYASDTLDRIRQNLGADYLILGSYFDMGKISGGTIRLDLRLQDAHTGELLASVSKAGTEADLPALASLAGADLRMRMGAADLSKAQAASLTESQPSNPETARLYADGLARLRDYDNLGAQASLEKLVSETPNFAPAHSALADAYSALGSDAKARDEAEKAFDLSNSLDREQRMEMEARYRVATREWDKAIAIDRALWHDFPDNVEYGLRLANAQNSAAKSTDALQTVAQMRKLPPPSSQDPRLDIVAAQGAESMGDYGQENSLSQRAAERADGLGAGLLAASARHLQCWALNRLGQTEKALAACEQARQVYARAGDRDSVARVLITSGSVLEERGQFPPAQTRYDEALAIHKTTGDQAGESLALNVLAVLNVDSGHYASARTMYEQSVSIARKNGDQDAVMNGLGNLANLDLLEGDLPKARRVYDELIVICRRLNSKNRTALHLNNLGSLLYLQGDLPAAQKALQEAESLDRETGDQRQLSNVLSSLGELFQAEAKLSEARQSKTEALQLQVALGNPVEAADARLALAESSVEEGRPADAIAPLQQAIAELKALKSDDEEAEGYPILAEAYLLQGKLDDAQQAIESGAAVTSKSRNRMVQLGAAIVEAEVRAARGAAVPAEGSLGRIITETRKSGFYGYELEARLALAEIKAKSGGRGASAVLRSLEQEARQRGFLLLAKKAATVAASGSTPAHAS